MYRSTLTLCAVLTLAACGAENNDTNNTASNNTAGNSETANNTTTDTNNTTTDTSNTAGTNGMEAGEGTFAFSLVVNGTEASETCVEGRDFGEVDELGAGYAGDQANIACPAVIGVALENPSAFVVLKDYEDLPATFSFTEAEAGSEFELGGDAGGTEELSHNTATAVTFTGTWDATTRNLTGAVDAEFEARDGFGGGTMNGSFNVTLPE